MSELSDVTTAPTTAGANAVDSLDVSAGAPQGEFVTFPDSPFQLFQPYAPAGDQPTEVDHAQIKFVLSGTVWFRHCPLVHQDSTPR